MGNSLQDQLLKAGLVNEQKAKQTRSAKRKKNKQAGGKATAGNEDRQRVQQAAAEKATRDRELNRQREEAARRKAEANELRQLIHAHRIPRRDGDVPYSFLDGDSLKRIYVTVEQQGRLAGGKLAVVRQDMGYELVSVEIAEKIRSRDRSLVLVLNRPGEQSAEDDEYADYKVPDDLMW
ncbi:MAG: DUF2058 domain-containing protein [Pseudomonadota bacterium]|nr:DUF2058 domain-containing protein [Pseudomonadota bacterium]